MDLVLSLALVGFFFVLALLAVVFLHFKLNKSLVEDILSIRLDMQRIEKQINLCLGSNNRLQNKNIKAFDDIIQRLKEVAGEASEANSATQTILKEYELNGVPLGYIRKEKEEPIDAYEGI